MIKTVVYNISVWFIPVMILVTLLWGLVKKIPVYEVFVDGAKDGLKYGLKDGLKNGLKDGAKNGRINGDKK